MKNVFGAILLAISFLLATPAQAQKLNVEDLVAKHLDAIGASNARNALKNQVALGTVSFNILRNAGLGTDGKAVIASDGDKVVFGMSFVDPNYPMDKFGYDGKDFKIAFVRPGVRSPLGNFLYSYESVFEKGLLGGVLSTAWSLKNVAAQKAKLESDGMRKINDKETYVVSYLPKKGSDLAIKMFFDAKTFQHVRTEYRRVISAQQGSNPDASAGQRETRQTLIEEFDSFKKENNLVLPHSYRIYLSFDGQSGTSEYEWKFNFSQFYFNQQLDANTFNFDSK